jgi:hypothetical protein
MSLRLTILTLVAILALGVAVPALGQSSKVTPRVAHGLSVRALSKARLALLTARSAKGQASRALKTSQAAESVAADAKRAVAAAQASLDASHVQSGLASSAVSTESGSYAQLPGGPTVSIDIPSSGLVEVWAQATFAGEGAIALFEDGQRMQGQSEGCAPEIASSALLASSIESPFPTTLSTPSSVTLIEPSGFFCGVEGPPAGVLFQTSPGHHTYELRYESCGCSPEVTFSKRLLRIAPRL